MTLKNQGISLSDERLERFYTACKDCGIKVTHQRLEIFREIAIACDHPSAEDIHQRVKKRMPMISLDTIYRTLSLFEQCRIISRVHPLDDHSRFDPNTEIHQHFICTRCKKIIDFTWPDFNQLPPPPETQQWGQIQSQSAKLLGICNECLTQRR